MTPDWVLYWKTPGAAADTVSCGGRGSAGGPLVRRAGLHQPAERGNCGLHIGDGRILVREGFKCVDRTENPERFHGPGCGVARRDQINHLAEEVERRFFVARFPKGLAGLVNGHGAVFGTQIVELQKRLVGVGRQTACLGGGKDDGGLGGGLGGGGRLRPALLLRGCGLCRRLRNRGRRFLLL